MVLQSWQCGSTLWTHHDALPHCWPRSKGPSQPWIEPLKMWAHPSLLCRWLMSCICNSNGMLTSPAPWWGLTEVISGCFELLTPVLLHYLEELYLKFCVGEIRPHKYQCYKCEKSG